MFMVIIDCTSDVVSILCFSWDSTLVYNTIRLWRVFKIIFKHSKRGVQSENLDTQFVMATMVDKSFFFLEDRLAHKNYKALKCEETGPWIQNG